MGWAVAGVIILMPAATAESGRSMFDAPIRRAITPSLDRLSAVLARFGFSANVLTISGFLFGCVAWAALAYREYELALFFIGCNRVADGLDGPLARRLGPTDLGGYLDIVLDFFFYAGVPFFFAVGRPEFALPAAFLVFSFVGTGSSFLAFSVIAAKRGITTVTHGPKAMYYLSGLAEGAETVVAFVWICLFPDLFPWIAWILGGLCWLTALTRVTAAVRAFRSAENGGQRVS
jgi:phosphatidylglycerophosphate synthase